jgi:hypothetical protein
VSKIANLHCHIGASYLRRDLWEKGAVLFRKYGAKPRPIAMELGVKIRVASAHMEEWEAEEDRWLSAKFAEIEKNRGILYEH